jgi:Protein of unknown function (DUF2690)
MLRIQQIVRRHLVTCFLLAIFGAFGMTLIFPLSTAHAADLARSVRNAHTSSSVTSKNAKALFDPNDPSSSKCTGSKHTSTSVNYLSKGVLTVWWSDSCQTNWAEVTYSGKASVMLTIAQQRLDSGGAVQCNPTSCNIGDWRTGSSPVKTGMIFSPNNIACAYVYTPQHTAVATAARVCM